MNEERVKELRQEGYSQGENEVKDAYFDQGYKDGKIKTLKNIFFEVIQDATAKSFICSRRSQETGGRDQ